ncbi:hypothetical protein [Staphylococcus phage PT1-1]
MKTYVLYEHVNKKNGKKYIGITNDISVRWRNNGIAYKPYDKHAGVFWLAIQKYGWDGFEHNILVEGLTFEEACDLEIKEIAKYDMRKDLYNRAIGGNGGLMYLEHPKGMLGKTHSQEYKDMLRERMSGENNPFYGKSWDDYGGHPKGMFGKRHTEEKKKQISETLKKNGTNNIKIKCVFYNGEEIIFNSLKECAESFNISKSSKSTYRLLETNEPYYPKAKNQYTEKIKLPLGTRLYRLS